MAVATYDIGDDVLLQATFEGLDGTPTSPDAVTCGVKSPDGAITAVGLSEVSTGVFEGTYAPVMHGQHWYRFEGTGVIRAAAEGMFNVRTQYVIAED
jgi:hypothetical protein